MGLFRLLLLVALPALALVGLFALSDAQLVSADNGLSVTKSSTAIR